MLVRGGMEDDLRPELLENMFKTRSIEEISDEWNNSVGKATVDEFLLDLKKLDFALLDKEQLARSVGGDLAAEFAADAAACASYHDDAATKGTLNFFAAELNLFTSKQSLQFDRP